MKWNGKKRSLTQLEIEALKVLAVQQEAATFAGQRYVLDLISRRKLRPDEWQVSEDLTTLVRKPPPAPQVRR